MTEREFDIEEMEAKERFGELFDPHPTTFDHNSLNRDSPQPLYAQIKDMLQDMIEMVPLQPYDKIESERELEQRFNVNRLTVRKALNELVQEGVLFRQTGKGTFVSPPKITQPLLVVRSFTDAMLQEGRLPGTYVHEVSMRPGTGHVCRQLKIDTGSLVFRLVRVRTVNDVPIALITSFIPYDLAPNLEPANFESLSLYALLREKCKHQLVHSYVTLEPTLANHQEAELLGVDPGLPMMLLRGLVYNQSERIVEYSKALYRGDKVRFAISAEQKKDDS